MWASLIGRGGIAVAAIGAVTSVIITATWVHDAYAAIITIETIVLVPVAIVGAAAVRAAPRNVVGWLLLVGGTTWPLAVTGYLYGSAVFDHGHDLPAAHSVAWLDGWPWVTAQLGVALFVPLLFPDGKLTNRRWRIPVTLSALLALLLGFAILFETSLLDWADEPNPTALPGAAGDLASDLVSTIVLVPVLATVAAIGFERKRRSTTDPTAFAAMQQLRPAVWLMVASWCGCLMLAIAEVPTQYALPVESLGMVGVGVTSWIAVRRYQLFDAKLVIRRSLVAGGLSLLVVAVYGAVAYLLSSIGASALSAPAAVVLAVLVAVPLRDQLQRAANRLVYGTRDDPVASLLSLGDQLERAAAATDVLPAAATSVRKSLRLDHVEIRDGDSIVAQSGRPSHGPREQVPLIYAGETVGILVATLGEGDRPLDAERKALLGGIARQVAAALRATSLSRDLSASHERLVAATEEERRRLGRDLHDGLGPALSSAVLGISRANALLVTKPEAAAEQLEVLTVQLQEAVADVRRLVYDLRPPALDHLGLVGALAEHAETLSHFTVRGPNQATSLSAAVEVAAYRIAMEAMTNAVRHGGVREGHVEVDVACADGLTVEGVRLTITDDGVGIPDGYTAGVGISSMRERAAELGGTLTVETGATRGTVVKAWLPS